MGVKNESAARGAIPAALRVGRALGLALGLAFAALPGHAEGPVVATDIRPVQALVARVMAGIGSPDLILPPGASPHGYALRPSEAAALQRAQLVVWIGPELTPWMARPIEALAGDAQDLRLLQVPGTVHLGFRDGPVFAPAPEAEGEEDAHHDGEHDHDHDHDHAAGAIDPHAWLDPENARLWLAAIAGALAELDPAHAAAYAANADAGAAEIAAAEAAAQAMLAPVADHRFVVFHDGWQYFEARFGLQAAGSIELGDAAEPGPARIAAIRDEVARADIACVFSEPQFNPRLLATVTAGSGAATAAIDPLGSDLPEGPGLYPALIEGLARTIADCL